MCNLYYLLILFNNLVISIPATPILETDAPSDTNADTILLEEVEQWNTPEDLKLITPSSTSGVDNEKLRVASHIFTFKIISESKQTSFLRSSETNIYKEFKNVLRIPVLFDGMTMSKRLRHCGQKGSFADVYVVELTETLMVRVQIMLVI